MNLTWLSLLIVPLGICIESSSTRVVMEERYFETIHACLRGYKTNQSIFLLSSKGNWLLKLQRKIGLHVSTRQAHIQTFSISFSVWVLSWELRWIKKKKKRNDCIELKSSPIITLWPASESGIYWNLLWITVIFLISIFLLICDKIYF